jgi:hypothetical protein
MKVIVDTSVWSLALRRGQQLHDPYVALFRDLIVDGRVVLLGVVRQELLSGIRHAKQFERLSRQSAVKLLDSKVIYPDRASFSSAVRACIGEAAFAHYGVVICAAADQGRRYFQEKLGWLTSYKDELI